MQKPRTFIAATSSIAFVLIAGLLGAAPANAADAPGTRYYVVFGDVAETQAGSGTYSKSAVQQMATDTDSSTTGYSVPGAEPVGPDAIPVGPNGEGPDDTTSTSAAAGFSTAAVSTPYRKIDGGRWSDNRAKTVQVREGNSTWGWIHAQQHNVSMNMLIKTSKFPKNRIIQGTAIRYETPANEYRCGYFTCTITRTMTMAMIHEGKLTSDGYPRGLITSYCLGAGTCPDWVRRAAG